MIATDYAYRAGKMPARRHRPRRLTLGQLIAVIYLAVVPVCVVGVTAAGIALRAAARVHGG